MRLRKRVWSAFITADYRQILVIDEYYSCFSPFVTAAFPPSILAYINIINIFKKLTSQLFRMICPNKHDNN